MRFILTQTSDKIHKWENHGEVGTETWQCSKCGLTVKLKKHPLSSSLSCGGTESHSWRKL